MASESTVADRAAADRLAVNVPPFLAAGLLWFRLAATRGRHREVEADFERAKARLSGSACRLARTQFDHGEWLRGQHRSAEAEPLLAEAAAVFERLGARAELQRARRQRVSA